jgi:hypothetical protein
MAAASPLVKRAAMVMSLGSALFFLGTGKG